MNNPILGVGATYDLGRYRSDRLVRGHDTRGIFEGSRVSDGRPVVISVRNPMPAAEIMDSLGIDAPGVARLLFVGAPDGYRPPPENVPDRLGAVIEQRPAGSPIADHDGPMNPREIVRVAVGVLAVLRHAAAERIQVAGIRPETVYVVDEPGGARLAGITPRSIRILWHLPDGMMGSPFDGHSYNAPELWTVGDPTPTSDLFSTALTLWWACTRSHPYRAAPHESDDFLMAEDKRGRFTGPPELGRILEAILVADPEKRPSVVEVDEQLRALAKEWAIDPAVFPPPGLTG